MQDTALELPTKMEISGCYQVKSIKKEIKYTLNLSILDADGNACPIYCDDNYGNAVVKEGPFSAKLDIVKIEPKIKDPVWNSFWFSVKIVTDMTGVTIDKNGQPILTDDDLINGDLLSKDSPTILTEKNYNSRIVVVVSLVKIIDSVPVVWNNSDGNYATVAYTRIGRSEIKTSLMLHIVKNDKNFKEIARNILYPTQDSASDSNSDKDSDSNQDKDSDKDSDSEDAEDMKDDVEDAEDADDAEDAEDIEDDYDDNEDKDMEDEDPKP